MSAGIFGVFALFWFAALVFGLGGYILGIVAIVSVAQAPVEAFGPWWDNTRQTWIIGIAVSFLLPFGPFVTGLMWFTTGKRGLHYGPFYGRPFWAGAPRPAPPPPYWQPAPPPPPPSYHR
jgi:hypothetical protein